MPWPGHARRERDVAELAQRLGDRPDAVRRVREAVQEERAAPDGVGDELERPVAVRGAEARRIERPAREVPVAGGPVRVGDGGQHLLLQRREDGVLALEVVGQCRRFGKLAGLDVAEVRAVPGLEIGQAPRLEPAPEEKGQEDAEGDFYESERKSRGSPHGTREAYRVLTHSKKISSSSDILFFLAKRPFSGPALRKQVPCPESETSRSSRTSIMARPRSWTAS